MLFLDVFILSFSCDREPRALALCPAIIVSRELVSWFGVVDFVGLFSF